MKHTKISNSDQSVHSFDPSYVYELDGSNKKDYSMKTDKRNFKNLEKVLPLLPPKLIENDINTNNSTKSDCNLIIKNVNQKQPQRLSQRVSTEISSLQPGFSPVLSSEIYNEQDQKLYQNKSGFWQRLSSVAAKRKEKQNSNITSDNQVLSLQELNKKQLFENFDQNNHIPFKLPLEDTLPLNLVESTNNLRLNYQSQFTNKANFIPATSPKINSQQLGLDKSLVSKPFKSFYHSSLSNPFLMHEAAEPNSISNSISPPLSPQKSDMFLSCANAVPNQTTKQSIDLLSLPLPPMPRAKMDLMTTKQSVSNIINNFQYEEPELSQIAEDVLLDLKRQEQWLENNSLQNHQRYSKAVESFISEDLCVLDPTFTPDLSFNASFLITGGNQLGLSSNLTEFHLPLPTPAFSTENRRSCISMPFTPLQSTPSTTFSGKTEQKLGLNNNSSTDLLKTGNKYDDYEFNVGLHNHCYDRPRNAIKKPSLGLGLGLSQGSRKRRLAMFSSKLKSAAASIFKPQKTIKA